jgi:hypothetical protein
MYFKGSRNTFWLLRTISVLESQTCTEDEQIARLQYVAQLGGAAINLLLIWIWCHIGTAESLELASHFCGYEDDGRGSKCWVERCH